jgi:hypothetical protein
MSHRRRVQLSCTLGPNIPLNLPIIQEFYSKESHLLFFKKADENAHMKSECDQNVHVHVHESSGLA